MLKLPRYVIEQLDPFAQAIYGESTWEKVHIMVIGAILATGKRTVSAVLRVMGMSQERNYPKYHQVLSRAAWSGLEVSLILLRCLLKAFSKPDEPLVFGIDETIERRRGEKIAAKGIYRDGVRSSKSHFVKASGLRWMSLMWLTDIAWAQRLWALPFLTVLAPSERYFEQRGRKAKSITDWARQMVFQLRRWLPDRALIIVGDSTYAALDFLHKCQTLCRPVTVITRLRLDAALYEPAPARQPNQNGRPRLKGKRLPTLAQLVQTATTPWQALSLVWYDHRAHQVYMASGTAVWYHTGLPPVPIRWVLIYDATATPEAQALLCTDLTLAPQQILTFFMRRWQMEPTFQHVRTHLGVETQRQWSDQAIARTTPVLMGLFSLVTLLANTLISRDQACIRTAAWYPKVLPTFSDALALVRYHLWAFFTFQTSAQDPDSVKVPRVLLERFNELLCYTT